MCEIQIPPNNGKAIKASAVVYRIQVALAEEGRALRKATKKKVQNLGAYYLVDSNNNVLATHQDLTVLARYLGVLKDNERLA